MFLNFSRKTVQLICVIMLLLIQFDVFTPIMDAISYQLEVVENTMSENAESQTADEVYYRTGKNTQVKGKCLQINLLSILKYLFVPALTVQDTPPVPPCLGKAIQHHIIYCVYRI